MKTLSESTKRLLKLLDVALASGARDHDKRSRALISLQLGANALDHLDEVHRAALEFATAYWAQKTSNEAERAKFLEVVGRRGDDYVHTGHNRTPEGCANRIVWSALNTNSGLSIHEAEFLVDMALCAGLGIEQIEAAFRASLPELATVSFDNTSTH